MFVTSLPTTLPGPLLIIMAQGTTPCYTEASFHEGAAALTTRYPAIQLPNVAPSAGTTPTPSPAPRPLVLKVSD